MSKRFLQLSLLLVVPLVVAGCQCNGSNVKNRLKAEGEPCSSDDECETFLCDAPPGKPTVCVRKCAAGCRSTEVCTPLAANDRYACLPDLGGLCQQCELNTDCPYPGDKCMQLGPEKVCGRDCAFDGHCPSSYRCADGFDSSGAAAARQCEPVSGTCLCTTANSGQTRPCAQSNSIGTCNGVETCNPPGGWDSCTAHTPVAEICNGIDDDCNGQTDDGLGQTACGVGECRRVVDNCVGGHPKACVAGDAGVEICNEKDDDCNGIIDDGFDKQNDVNNCGLCGHVCNLPHTQTVSCVAGACHVVLCAAGWWNADGDDSNGCEYPCTISNGGVEVCDGLDNNCNGAIDEGFNTVTDPNNCGLCGRVCSVSNGHVQTYQCLASTCGILTCAAGFGDCDQTYATGCEQNTSTDINNCGSCNYRCTVVNGTAGCGAGACTVASCNSGYGNCDGNPAANYLGPVGYSTGCETSTASDTANCGTCGHVCPVPAHSTASCVSGGCGYICAAGYIDLNGLASDGCEFVCTPTGGLDDPDDASLDSNCDGIDGDVSRATFVAIGGNDGWPGTMALPKATVQAGINAASTSKPHVYVSGGVYPEALSLRNGISVFGGYNAGAGWRRDGSTVTITNSVPASGNIITARGIGLTSPTWLEYLTITTASTSTVGVSTYAVHCENCAGLVIRKDVITAGTAGPGAAAGSGTAGGIGFAGSAGSNGSCDNAAGPGGAGGPSDCGLTGGVGGAGGPEGANNGLPGANGSGGALGGFGGNRGSCGCCSVCSGSAGGPGASGSAGAAGSDGTGGAAGIVVGSFFVGGVGGAGLAGGGGTSGGGGGGGGGQGGTIVNDGGGNGGGGGGGAGCGGGAAQGGTAGGSSFAVFLINSTGATLSECQLTSGNGGTGGSGGTGGTGGVGGGGGAGATSCTGEVGAGGNGGAGGAGGRGGHGGGGAGGLSYALYKVNSTPTLGANITYAHGSAGGGGTSSGNAGAAGTAANFN